MTLVSNLTVVLSSFPSPKSVITYYFLVTNFEDSLSASPNKFTIFCVSIFIRSQNQATVAAFCENSKVACSDFSMIKKHCYFFISSKSSNEINLLL